MRDEVDTNVQLENLEELLLDLGDRSALALSAYAEDDDSVTRVLQVPEDSAQWLVAINVQDQRSLTTEEICRRLAHGELRADMLVWRRGLPTWQRLDSIAEVRMMHALTAAPQPLQRDALPARAAHAVRRVHLAPPVLALAAPVHRDAELRRVPMASCAPPPVEPSSAASAADTTTSAGATSAGATVEADPLVPPDIDLEGLSLESGSLRLKRAVMAVSALAMTAAFVTLFSISSTNKDKVREAARQREAAAAVKARAPEREPTAPEPASDESENDPPAARDEPSERRQLRSELLPAGPDRR